ncbi:hypothetical protein [Streptomyces sp. CBMA152]|uniref:hypothetical protein n=1 Tax=Streptomyces sp. CBMA152 TaxID=1896312 RepID=UPI001660B26D|nr:hypothetical protein [Streptomyces sp. CBMA152]
MTTFKRVAATLGATAVVLAVAVAPANAADAAGTVNNGLSFLRDSAEAIITFVKQVLA